MGLGVEPHDKGDIGVGHVDIGFFAEFSKSGEIEIGLGEQGVDSCGLFEISAHFWQDVAGVFMGPAGVETALADVVLGLGGGGHLVIL